MRKLPALCALFLFSTSFTTIVETSTTSGRIAIEGTWKLLSGTLIVKTDTTVTDYTKGQSFIKVINGDHFAFFLHDLTHGQDSATRVYSSGAGSYTLQGNIYTEHLEYCDAREWEGHDFPFTVSVKNDTLTIQGVEKIDSIGVNRYNIERYVRLKQ